MKDKQSINRIFNPIKSYLSFRSLLVNKIIKLIKGLNHEPVNKEPMTKTMVTASKISKKEEIHLAVAYLDSFYSTNEPGDYPEMEIVATMCVILAIKFSNDLSGDLKEYYDALSVAEKNVSMQDFLQIESAIIQALEWELWIRTPFEFLHFYLSRGVIFHSDKFGQIKLDDELLRSLRQICEAALEQSLYDYSNYKYSSHVVGAAAIACGRKGLGIYPIWNEELEELTGIGWTELEPLYNGMYESFESTKPDVIDSNKKSYQI